MHEPFTNTYYFSKMRQSQRYGDFDDLFFDTPEHVIQNIRGVKAPICFVKELSFQAFQYVPDEFIDSSTNTFLIRNPSEVFQSLMKLKPDFTEDEFGFVPLQVLWDRIAARSASRPIVVDAHVLRSDPVNTLQRYCELVRVDFDPSMLHWSDGRIREWAPHEVESQAKWHHTLERSHGFIPPDKIESIRVPAHRKPIVDRAMEIYHRISQYTI